MDVEQRRIEDLERQVETLGVAVGHRTTIGMALGIIMERLALDQDAAFEYLARCSQAQNQKVYDLAFAVVETRELPDSRGRQGA
jgi:AmiR/NasT family two-component response regulator